MNIPTTMHGVVLPGERRLETREFPVPTPASGQVLLQIKASALCGSDLRAIYRPKEQGHGPEAYRGVIAGHEPCGVVVAVGPDCNRFKVGDRVVAYHITGCGVCADCRAGWFITCSSSMRSAYGWQRDGGHAPYMLAEENTLVPLPEPLTFVDGAMVACGFGTAYAATNARKFAAMTAFSSQDSGRLDWAPRCSVAPWAPRFTALKPSKVAFNSRTNWVLNTSFHQAKAHSKR